MCKRFAVPYEGNSHQDLKPWQSEFFNEMAWDKAGQKGTEQGNIRRKIIGESRVELEVGSVKNQSK